MSDDIGPWYKRLFDIPWAVVREAFADIRREQFDAPRLSGPTILVDLDLDELRETFGSQGYAPNWELSHYSRGEELNLAQVVYHEPRGIPTTDPLAGRVWWQTHIRGYPVESARFGQYAIDAHWELEPSENGEHHLDGDGLDESVGIAHAMLALRRAGHVDGRDFQYAVWDRASGYTIRTQPPYNAHMEAAVLNTSIVEG